MIQICWHWQLNPGDSVMDVRQFLLDAPETCFFTCYDLLLHTKDGSVHHLEDYNEISEVADITTGDCSLEMVAGMLIQILFCLVGVAMQVLYARQYLWALTWDELWQRYMMIGLSEPMLIVHENCSLFPHFMHHYQHHLPYSMRHPKLQLQVQEVRGLSLQFYFFYLSAFYSIMFRGSYAFKIMGDL